MEQNILSWQEKNITEIADLERAKKGKSYDSGCTLVTLSASDGRVHFHAGGPVSERYGVIIPKRVDGRYLFEVISMAWPEHYHRTNSGINYKFSDLFSLKVKVHDDPKARENLIRIHDELNQQEAEIENTISQLIKLKKHLLATIFVKP